MTNFRDSIKIERYISYEILSFEKDEGVAGKKVLI